MAGKRLPAAITSNIANANGERVILFLSSSCSSCLGVAGRFAAFASEPMTAFVAGDEAAIAAVLSDVHVVGDPIATAVMQELEVSEVPVALHTRDSIILGSARSLGLESEDQIVTWLDGSRANAPTYHPGILTVAPGGVK